MIDYTEPRWRLLERVQRLVDRGRTREEAEDIVRKVIREKENPDVVIVVEQG
jgi:hypothetical protein